MMAPQHHHMLAPQHHHGCGCGGRHHMVAPPQHHQGCGCGGTRALYGTTMGSASTMGANYAGSNANANAGSNADANAGANADANAGSNAELQCQWEHHGRTRSNDGYTNGTTTLANARINKRN